MKFISPKVHGIIDLLVVIFLLASPTLFDFTRFTAVFTYALAGVHLVLTLVTDYEVGIIKALPFFLHGSIEFIVGDVLIALGYTLFNNDVTSKLFYICFGTVVLLTWLVTDYKGTRTAVQ